MKHTLAALAGLLALSRIAVAQCPSVDPGFADPTLNGIVHAAAVLDAGSGPQLYVAGEFTAAGGVTMNRIARWSTSFFALGAGTNGPVLALCAFDDGAGPALYVGGDFTAAGSASALHVARWNGSSWTPLSTGTDGAVRALAVFDDGSGPALYAGGDFASAGGVSADHVARWNGTSWSGVGGGIAGLVDALAVFDAGNGPALVAGGQFLSAGTAPARNVARFDGTAWSILGNGTNGRVRTLCALGGALHAGGDFTTAGGLPASHVARWSGTAWSPLGLGMNSSVHALLAFDDGSGPALTAGGTFVQAGTVGAAGVARWDGNDWVPVGDGLSGPVETLCAAQLAGATRLVAGGSYSLSSNGGLPNLARFDGARWSALSQGMAPHYVTRVAALDDGHGPKVYASGLFDAAGGVAANHLVRWVDGAWSIPTAGDWMFSFATHDEGSGPRAFAGGGFTSLGGVAANSVARYDGTAWSALGAGLNGNVFSLGTFDDGSGAALYAGGTFTASGSTPAHYVARWDGAAWSEVGGGLTPPFSQSYAVVRGMAVFDDGQGPALYVGGDFRRAGTVDAAEIARWDGSSWSALGSGLSSATGFLAFVNDLAVFDDGTGPALYAGGWFQIAGGMTVNHLAKWDGTSWSPLGGGTSSGVYALTVFDDGSGGGPALFAATASEGVLRWDGVALTRWADENPIPDHHAQTLCTLPPHDGAPAEMWVGGTFPTMNGVPSASIARFVACDSIGAVFCSGDGSGTACPCGNSGASGNGCASSFDPQGAHLSARGNPSVSADSVVLEATAISNAIATIFQGTARVNGGAGAVFGDGLRCAGGTNVRIAAVAASANAMHYPHAGDAAVSVRGQVPGTGGKRAYQVWYRNAASFCTSATFNFTNGLELTWAP